MSDENRSFLRPHGLNVLTGAQRRLVKDALRSQIETDLVAAAGASSATSTHEKETNVGFSREFSRDGGLRLGDLHRALDLDQAGLDRLTRRLGSGP